MTPELTRPDGFDGLVCEVAPRSQPSQERRPRVKTIALPTEHGGWAFLLEPLALGLLLAPSLSGLFLALAALGVFLARHPAKLAVGDLRRRRRLTRTAMAERFVFAYAGAAALCFVAAVMTATGSFLFPLIIAAPFTAVQFFYDGRGKSRALMAEMAGGISTGAIAVAIALANGWDRRAAFALWAIMLARTVPSILYVRGRLRLLRRKHASVFLIITAHVLAVVLMFTLAGARVISFLVAAAMSILLVRAAGGLLRTQRAIMPKQLGIAEIIYGTILVCAVVFGRVIGW